MKIVANISRILVGVIFVFSGFVKVVDPVGTGIKLEEYFEVFSQDLPVFQDFFMFLAHHSLFLSLVFCALEVILGVATLLSYRMKVTSYFLLGIILFFTFLTFYSAYFNKVTDCGCFGDFLKLKPWTSFQKDVFLTFFIIIIFLLRQQYPSNDKHLWMSIVSIVSFGIGIYAILYLPPIDFLPYAIGKSIPEQMKPTGVKPEVEYTFLNKKSDEKIVSKEYLMDTLTYKFVSMETLNEDKLRPKITDYALSDIQGNIYTDSSFVGKKMLIIFRKLPEIKESEVKTIQNLIQKSMAKGIRPMILTSATQEEYQTFANQYKLENPFYFVDATVLKTMARTNPCIILLENGVVIGKWGNRCIPNEI